MEEHRAAASGGSWGMSSGIGNVGELPLSAPVAQYGIFVNNLPINADEAALKALFEPYGQVQRLIVVNRPDFTTHSFGYVLMDTDDGTKRAIHQLNGVRFGQMRLTVEPTFGRVTHIFGIAEGSPYIRNRAAAQEEQERRSQGRQNFRDRQQSGDRWQEGFGDRHRYDRQGDRGGHRNFQYNGRQNFRYGDRRDNRFGDHRGNRQGFGSRWNRGYDGGRGGHGDGQWRPSGHDYRSDASRLQDQLEQETAPRLRDAWNRQLESEAHWPSFEQLLQSLVDVFYDQLPPRDLRLADPPLEDTSLRSLWVADDGGLSDVHSSGGKDAWTEIFVLRESSPSTGMATGLVGGPVDGGRAGESAAPDGGAGQQGSLSRLSMLSEEKAMGTHDKGNRLTAAGFSSGGVTLNPGEASVLGYPKCHYDQAGTTAPLRKVSECAFPSSQGGDGLTKEECFQAEGNSCESVAVYEDNAATEGRVDHEAVALCSAITGAAAATCSTDEPAVPGGHQDGNPCRTSRDKNIGPIEAGHGSLGNGFVVSAKTPSHATVVAIPEKTEGAAHAVNGDVVLVDETNAAVRNQASSPQKICEPPAGNGSSEESELVSDNLEHTVPETVEQEASLAENGGVYETSQDRTASLEQSSETLNVATRSVGLQDDASHDFEKAASYLEPGASYVDAPHSGPRPVQLDAANSGREPSAVVTGDCADSGAHKSSLKRRQYQEAGNSGSEIQGAVGDASTTAFTQDRSEGVKFYKKTRFADEYVTGDDNQTSSRPEDYVPGGTESSVSNFDRGGRSQLLKSSAADKPTAAACSLRGNSADESLRVHENTESKPGHGDVAERQMMEGRAVHKAAGREKKASMPAPGANVASRPASTLGSELGFGAIDRQFFMHNLEEKLQENVEKAATNEAAKLPGAPLQRCMLNGTSGQCAPDETPKQVVVHFETAENSEHTAHHVDSGTENGGAENSLSKPFEGETGLVDSSEHDHEMTDEAAMHNGPVECDGQPSEVVENAPLTPAEVVPPNFREENEELGVCTQIEQERIAEQNDESDNSEQSNTILSDSSG